MKVVISSHPNYHTPLGILLDSLKYRDHLDDIIVCVSDVPDDASERVIEEGYVQRYGLKRDHVLTSPMNIDEYTSYLSLGNALRAGQFADEAYFLMIHDTCEAGRLFWDKAVDLEQEVRGPRFIHVPETGTHKITTPIVHPISISDGTTLMLTFYEFVYSENLLITFCKYMDNGEETGYVGYLAKDGRITQQREHALVVPGPDPAAINAAIERMYMWFPVSTNFNIGVASREFVADHASVNFAAAAASAPDSGRFSKAESIDVEINPENPLNLQRQAGDRWRYTYCALGDRLNCRIPTMSIWVNDTDVYHDGKKRNVSVIHPIDLKKYSVLVGKAWSQTHPSRA